MINRSLYSNDHAALCKSSAGQPYRPSNGLEGELFMANWCADCVRDAAHRADPDRADGCPIIAATMRLDVTDPNYPTEWTYGEDGQPKCTAHATMPEAAARCPDTPDMFAVEG